MKESAALRANSHAALADLRCMLHKSIRERLLSFSYPTPNLEDSDGPGPTTLTTLNLQEPGPWRRLVRAPRVRGTAGGHEVE